MGERVYSQKKHYSVAIRYRSPLELHLFIGLNSRRLCREAGMIDQGFKIGIQLVKVTKTIASRPRLNSRLTAVHRQFIVQEPACLSRAGRRHLRCIARHRA
jgi:hypothetical protein